MKLASFVLDYVVRQKIAGTQLTYGYVTQLPALPPSAYDDELHGSRHPDR